MTEKFMIQKKLFSFRSLAYLAVSVVLLFVLALSCIIGLFYKTAQQQTTMFHKSILKNSISEQEEIISSIKGVFNSASFDSSLFELINSPNIQPLTLLHGLQQLNVYRQTTYFIDSIYVYNCQNHMVYVSSPNATEAVWTLDQFYDNDASVIFRTYQNYENAQPIFRNLTVSYPAVERIGILSFLRYNTLALPSESSVLMINVRQNAFWKQINLLANDMGSDLFLLDKNGQTLFLSDSESSPSISIPQDTIQLILSSPSSDGYFLTGHSDGSRIICYQPIFDGYYTLVSVTGQNPVLNLFETNHFFTLIAPFFFLFLFLCISCSAIFFKLSKIYHDNQEKLELSKKEKREKSFENRRQAILSFLHTTTVDSASLQLLANEQVLLDESMGARVLILVLDHYHTDVTLQYETATDRALVKYSICNITEELLSELGVKLTVYEADARCVSVVQPSPDEGNLLEKLSLLQQQLQCLANISVTIFVSQPTIVAQIPTVYESLCNALPYKQLFGSKSIITADMLDHREIFDSTIPGDSLKNLAKEVLKLNIDEALLQLEKILELISQGSYKSFQIGLMQVITTLDGTLNTLQCNYLIEKNLYTGTLIYSLSNLESVEDICTNIADILYQVKESILHTRSGHQQELIEKIKNMVQENYASRDFSINIVADQVNLSAAYLGRLFKKVTGVTFVEYVLETRMDVARHLLKDTNLAIEKIVTQVGFSDTPISTKSLKKKMVVPLLSIVQIIKMIVHCLKIKTGNEHSF